MQTWNTLKYFSLAIGQINLFTIVVITDIVGLNSAIFLTLFHFFDVYFSPLLSFMIDFGGFVFLFYSFLSICLKLICFINFMLVFKIVLCVFLLRFF